MESKKKNSIWKAKAGNKSFEVEEKISGEFYLQAFENGELVNGYKKGTFEQALNFALNEFSVPKDSWVKVKEDEQLSAPNSSVTLDTTIEREENIRQKWLTSMIVFAILSVCLSFLKLRGHLESTPNEFDLTDLVSGTIINTALFALWFWLTYNFAYKKRGTIWLGLNIIATFMALVIAVIFIGILFMPNSFFEGKYLAVALAFGLIILCAELYYFINCIRLYRLNSRRKKVLMSNGTKNDPLCEHLE